MHICIVYDSHCHQCILMLINECEGQWRSRSPVSCIRPQTPLLLCYDQLVARLHFINFICRKSLKSYKSTHSIKILNIFKSSSNLKYIAFIRQKEPKNLNYSVQRRKLQSWSTYSRKIYFIQNVSQTVHHTTTNDIGGNFEYEGFHATLTLYSTAAKLSRLQGERTEKYTRTLITRLYCQILNTQNFGTLTLAPSTQGFTALLRGVAIYSSIHNPVQQFLSCVLRSCRASLSLDSTKRYQA
jgi:hypothetical protein